MIKKPVLNSHHYITVVLLLVFSFLFSSNMLFARESSQRDTVFLRNGEILIGDIRELQLGILSFDSKNMDILSIKISKIKTISSASDTLRIETSDKAIYYGALQPSEKAGWVYIVTASDHHLVEIAGINSLLSYEKPFWENLSGNVSAGFSYSRSSDIGQLNFSASVAYTAKLFEVQVSGSAMASIDSTDFSRDQEDLSLTAYYNVKKMWYAVAAVGYQRNLQLSIARRYQELAAAGYKVVVSKSFQIMGITGVAVSQERSTSGDDQNFLFELPIGFYLNFYRFSHPDIQISSKHTLYVGLTQWGRIRYDSSTTFAWELFKDFSFSLNLYLNYDNQPPDVTTGKIDYGTVIGLAYKF